MIELTHKVLTELILLFIFLLAIASYASYVFGSKVTRILERQAALKKQTDSEFELTTLFELSYEDLKNELESEIDVLQHALLMAKLDARYIALDWTNSQPNEPWAHWQLAKAYHQLEEYANVKKTLTRIQDSFPGWNTNIEDWIKENDARLSEQLPAASRSQKE